MARVLVGLTVLTVLAGADRPPKRWKASLDDPPETRWAHIQSAYAEDIHTLAKEYGADVPSWKQSIYAQLMDFGYLDEELKIEMTTLARIANITYSEAAFLNFMYEYNAYCTSVIVQLANGTIIHGRNLDYPGTNLLRKTIVDVDVYRNQTLLWRMSWFPWYLGINTAVKPGLFSLSLNQRDQGSWTDNILALLHGYQGNFFRSRTALTMATSYEAAVNYLATANTVAASYDIIASPSTGAIITRNRASTERIIPLPEGGWYLVETNHDWWLPDPVGDNRTATAEAYLNEIGQEAFGEDNMIELLSIYPVENPITVFTALMVPETGYYRAIIRD